MSRLGERRVARWVVLVAAVALAAGCAGGDDPRRIPLGADVGAASADGSSLPAAAEFDFVLADGVDLPASETAAWRWEAPDAAAVGDLADRLGIGGSVVDVPVAGGEGWVVEDVASGAVLNVAANGSWWGAGDDSRSFAVSSDEDVLSAASTIFGESTSARIDSRAGRFFYVLAEYLVEGQPSGQVGFLGVDTMGWSASGLLATPVREGPYPTVSAAEAVGRLVNSPLGLGLVAVPGTVGVGVLDEPDPSIGPAPDPGVVVEPLPVEPLPVEPVPVEPNPFEPVPTEVVLVDVEATLVSFVDGTGVIWSLPGYVYTDADGGEWEVVAVAEESFDLSPEVPDGGAVDPPVDGDTPVGDVPDVVPPEVVGLGELEATSVLEAAGFSVRVAERDGEPFMLTKDYRTDRVNLVVAGGVVTSVWVG